MKKAVFLFDRREFKIAHNWLILNSLRSFCLGTINYARRLSNKSIDLYI
ncbi:hypothetical protein [Halocella sp. SP3-1]|nr:hypothetical protein [Halocella sp. SP3-1]AZO93424.1 hypothetical protein D7D81_01760 [Halocella sp. SP3-1]